MSRILYDWQCSACGTIFEAFGTPIQEIRECDKCGQPAHKAMISFPHIDQCGMAQGNTASPGAIDYFDKIHRQQKAIEARHMREHGDIGPTPGA